MRAAAIGALAVSRFQPAPAHAQALPQVLAADAQPVAPSAPAKKTKAPKTSKPKTPAYVHNPDAGPWDRGALWITVRAGYNQVSYNTAGNGGVGAGFGFTRMLGPAWSFGGLAENNVIGQFGNARESEIPLTLELDRHIHVSEAFRLYWGLGGGVYYHKFSNTTADYSDVRNGGLICIGGNAVVSPHQLFGLDGRMSFVGAKSGVPTSNPVFGPQKSTTMRWSVKATWSVTY